MKPKLKRDWIGLRVRTLVDMQNFHARVPKGSTASVEDSFNGLSLQFDPCFSCGVKFFIRKVPQHDVEIIERDEELTMKLSGKRRRRIR